MKPHTVGMGRSECCAVLMMSFVIMLAASLSSAQVNMASAVGPSPLKSEKKARPSEDSGPFDFFLFPSILYDTESVDGTVVTGDLNGDGKLDVVAFGTNAAFGGGGLVMILLGNGDGTLQPAVTYSSGGYALFSQQNGISGALVDLNGDGKLDVVVINCSSDSQQCYGNGSVGVLLGNGDGTFQPVVTYDIGGGGGIRPSLAVGDFNRDGKPDVVAACESSNCNPAGFSVLLGNGDGTLQPAVLYSPFYRGTIMAADVNGDGKLDLVGEGVVRLGNGDGTFQPALANDSGGTYLSVGDVNGDGKLDILDAWGLLSDQVGVLLGNGDGTFQPEVFYDALSPFSQFGPNSVIPVDIDGNGKLDLVVSGGGTGVLPGNGDGTFGPMVPYDLGAGFAAVALGDLNRDHKPDLIVLAPYFYSGEQVSVLLNNSGAPATTISLASDINPVTTLQPVNYTAVVTRQGGGTVTGSVQFMFGGPDVNFGGPQVPVAGNQAVLSTSYSRPGTDRITAVYSGEFKAAGSISTPITETILGASTTKVSTSGSPSQIGQPVTFNAKVKSKFGKIPDGELVAFVDGKTSLASVPLSGGIAFYTTSTLSGGLHVISGTYIGDGTFATSTGSVKQKVNGYPTTTALASSPNPSSYKGTVTFTATVTSAGPTPTGKVKFVDGTTVIGTATLSGGVATLKTSKLAAGSHSITADYKGDNSSEPSVSPRLVQVVNL